MIVIVLRIEESTPGTLAVETAGEDKNRTANETKLYNQLAPAIQELIEESMKFYEKGMVISKEGLGNRARELARKQFEK